MDPLFTEEQLNKMSREDIISLMKTMREHYQKQETKIQILEEKTKELEFLRSGNSLAHPAKNMRMAIRS